MRKNHSNRIGETTSDRWFNILCTAIVVILLVLVAYPVIYVISASFSNAIDLSSGKVWLWPVRPNLEAYERLVQYRYIWLGYRNTIIYTVVGTLINIAVTLMCAYPLSRRNLRGRGPITFLFTFTMLFSGGMIPNYILIKNLGLLNSVWAVMLPGAMSVYNMIVARTFIQSNVPDELWESAQLDGCGSTRFFFKMVLPLVKPIIAVLALWYAVGHWNSYFSAFMYLRDSEKYPLQLFLKELLIQSSRLSELERDPNDLSLDTAQYLHLSIKYAIIVISSAPLMALYPFVQKHFRHGVLMGSVKG